MIYKALTSIKNHTFTLLSKYCVHNFGNWRKNRQTDRLWTHYLPLASLEAQKLRVIMTLLLLSVSVFHSRRWRGFIPQTSPKTTFGHIPFITEQQFNKRWEHLLLNIADYFFTTNDSQMLRRWRQPCVSLTAPQCCLFSHRNLSSFCNKSSFNWMITTHNSQYFSKTNV